MILILDLGIGNIGSIKNALNFLNFNCLVSNRVNDLKKAEKLIIPGNGSFGSGMKKINDLKIKNELNNFVLIKKKPVLGICLGYQLMLQESEEDKNYKGLSWVKGKVIKFKKKKFFPIPHVGWNDINFNHFSLSKNIPNNSKFYFDHSYFTEIKEKNIFYGETNYIKKFKSIYEKNNIFGCQPHLEKSQKFGLQLLKNFCEI